jgi:hypothetical protein
MSLTSTTRILKDMATKKKPKPKGKFYTLKLETECQQDGSRYEQLLVIGDIVVVLSKPDHDNEVKVAMVSYAFRHQLRSRNEDLTTAQVHDREEDYNERPGQEDPILHRSPNTLQRIPMALNFTSNITGAIYIQYYQSRPISYMRLEAHPMRILFEMLVPIIDNHLEIEFFTNRRGSHREREWCSEDHLSLTEKSFKKVKDKIRAMETAEESASVRLQSDLQQAKNEVSKLEKKLAMVQFEVQQAKGKVSSMVQI